MAPLTTSKILPSKLLETMNTISRKKRKKRNIFEKFGLALTPNSQEMDQEFEFSEKLKRKKSVI